MISVPESGKVKVQSREVSGEVRPNDSQVQCYTPPHEIRLEHLPVVAGAFLASAPSASAATCESLTSLSLPRGVVTLAETVSPGAFSPPTGSRRWTAGRAEPVREAGVVLSRGADAEAGIRSPTSRRKCGCLRQDGTASCRLSATAGSRGRSAMPRWRTALAAGYAAASTDTGHTGPSSEHVRQWGCAHRFRASGDP